MKKIYTLVLCTALILALFSFSSLASVPTPWTSADMKIQIIEDFSDKADAQINVPGDEDFDCFGHPDQINGKYEWKNGAFVHYANDATGDWFAYKSPKIAALGQEAFSKAAGFGCYVENNSENDYLRLGFVLLQEVDNSYLIHSSMGDMYYASADGSDTDWIDIDESWNQSVALIEPGFKGYIIVPFSSVKNQQTGAAWDPSGSYLSQIGFLFHQSIASSRTGANTVIDNFFLYGENVTDNNNGTITGALAYPGSDQTPNPSDKPTDAQTQTPQNTSRVSSTAPAQGSDSPSPSQQGDTQKTDSSILIYVIIAAIVIIGAGIIIFIIAKKPKNTDKDNKD